MKGTVAAICTPLKMSAIGVIRISGDDAIGVASRVFAPQNKDILKMPGYTAAFGHVYDDEGDFDEGVLTVFRAPHSYTGEDVAELSLHGGSAVLTRAIRAVIAAGATPAGRGEFTKRALLNGKLSLTEAEAVMDVISAESKDALRCAENALAGAIYKRIHALIERLEYIAASVAQYIDFPEEGEQYYDREGLKNGLNGVKNDLVSLINSFDEGAKIRHGIDCVIAGRPNVGKSTLMNLLTDRDISIVTSVAGTTRDIVEQSVEIGGISLNLSDTAGIRASDDIVEKIGVDKARDKIHSAQLVLALFAADEPVNEDDFDILEAIKDTPHIIILNKTDLSDGAGIIRILRRYGNVIEISATKRQGIDALKDEIVRLCDIKQIGNDSVYLANERQLFAAQDAVKAIDDAICALTDGVTLDAVSVMVEAAITSLLELTGERASEEVIAQVFEKFCVGK